MARDLHSSMKEAKNTLASSDAWILLFTVDVSDTEVVRVTNNEEPVTFAGIDYEPFPVLLEGMEEGSSGDLPYINITVGNIGQVLTDYLEQRNGLLDKSVNMRLVHKGNLADSDASISISLVIRETTVTESSVNFRVSHHPFFEVSMPHQRYYRERCRWRFKSGECGWAFGGSGTDSDSCDKTLDGSNGCQAHGTLSAANGDTVQHPGRFGGFPGIPRRRV